MHITMRYFASLREGTGRTAETLDVPNGSDVASLRQLLVERQPSLASVLARSRCAVNRTYAEDSTLLSDGDELAFIPPVGGG